MADKTAAIVFLLCGVLFVYWIGYHAAQVDQAAENWIRKAVYGEGGK